MDGIDNELVLANPQSLLLQLGTYEGPIDLLLDLVRQQKVDLEQIDILQLAEQYIHFVESAQQLDLELAAEYLVMAAWLAYLKSRLLLPKEEVPEDEPDPAEMAEWLAYQLQRLQAMRDMAEKLMDRAQLGQDFFAPTIPANDDAPNEYKTYQVTLYDLLKAYAKQHTKKQPHYLSIESTELYSMEDAVEHLSKFVGKIPSWQSLEKFIPKGSDNPVVRRSAVASTFAASLELVRTRKIIIQQLATFGPIYISNPKNG